MSAQPTRQRRSFQEFTKMATPASETVANPASGESVIDLGSNLAMQLDAVVDTAPIAPAAQLDAEHNVTRSGLAPAGAAKATLEIPKATALPAEFDDAPNSSAAVTTSARSYATTMISLATPLSPVVEAATATAVAPSAYVAPAAPAVKVAQIQAAPSSVTNKKTAALLFGLLAFGGGVVAMTHGSAETVVAPLAPTTEPKSVATPTVQAVAPVVAEVAPATTTMATKTTAKGVVAAAPVAVAPVAPVAPVAAAEPAKVAPVAPAAPVVVGDLEGAINRAAGPVKSAGDVTTEGGQDRANVPQRPSQGAMTGALRPNISAANKCLDDGIGDSRATVTFESSGKAQGVAVTGPAAGTAAEACIVKALMKTKIAPFADTTYSTPVTIRH